MDEISSHLEFFVDFAVTGRVFGVGFGARPEDWSAALGDDFTDFSGSERGMVRQFGLVDAHFIEDPGGWSCHLIALKPGALHRFDDWVPDPIAARYGKFPARVPFDDVADLVVGAGLAIDHVVRRHVGALETYWVPDSKVKFSLISAYQAEEFPALRIGDVFAASTDEGLDIPGDLLRPYR